MEYYNRGKERSINLTNEESLERKIKILTIVFLTSFSVLLTSIFQTHLEDYMFYMHFFYLPIVLSTFWWGRRGIIVSIFLGVTLLSTSMFRHDSMEEIFTSGIGAILFFIVALLVGILSDEKSDALKKEMQFKLDTAHYFFNPICIVEGNIDLATKDAPSNIKEFLRDAQMAIQRIKKIVINVVDIGEIHE